MTASLVRVVVGEDQPIFRDGLVHILEMNGCTVLGAAGDAEGLIRQVEEHQPDIVIADIQMPPDRTDDGLRAVVKARAYQPGLGILLLSQFLDSSYAVQLVSERAEGVGYLLKEKVGDVSQFMDAVRRVADGGTVLDPEVVKLLVARPRKPGPLDDLTNRERTVLELIAEGRSNAGIAECLFVTVGAVERHVARIYAKLGLREGQGKHRRVLAVLEYLKGQ